MKMKDQAYFRKTRLASMYRYIYNYRITRNKHTRNIVSAMMSERR